MLSKKIEKQISGGMPEIFLPPIDPKIGRELALTYQGIVRKFWPIKKHSKFFSKKPEGRAKFSP